MLSTRKQYPRLSLVSIVLASVIIALLFGTGALEAAAKGVTDFVQRLWVGDYTWIQQTSPSQSDVIENSTLPTGTTIETRDGMWTIRTAIGNFGGDVFPGRNTATQRFNTVNEAQVSAPFHIYQPNFLPAGYEFQEVIVSPLDWMFLFYDGPSGELVIAELPVGKVSDNEANVQTPAIGAGHITTVGVGMLTDKQIESVTLNGRSAGWVDGSGLMWEADGISFVVGGPNLTREEIMKIAESLE